MRVAAIYDIHGNLPALEAVLDEIVPLRVDQVVVGGDVVLGPMPCEVLELLLELDVPTHFVRGNTDREVLAQMRGEETEWFSATPEKWRGPVSWAAQKLSDGHRVILAGWPTTCSAEVGGLGEVLFCHATPRDDNEVFTKLTPEDRLAPVFEGVVANVIVCGHTHMQFDRRVGEKRIINAGSVGMPFGETGANWLLLGPDVQLRHTNYDLTSSSERINATEYPEVGEFVAKYVIQSPSATEMLEVFERVALQ